MISGLGKYLLPGLLTIYSAFHSCSGTEKENILIVDADQGQYTISKHIYGHFSEHLGRCIYGGIWVGEDSEIPNIEGYRKDVLEALKEIRVPVLRWPGGCFADTYHWRDGIGPPGQRPSIVNVHWGNVTEDNSFGTHEFMRYCELLGCEPYICGNIGSGSVREMAEWVEYLTSPAESPTTLLRKENGREEPWQLKFWGLGNEVWGCGGRMSVEYYVDKAANYNAFCRNYPGNTLYRIACGGYADRDDYHFTEVLMKDGVGRLKDMDAHAIHFYTPASNGRVSATEISEDEWFDILKNTLKMEDIIKQNIAIMDHYDPENKVDLIIDEWGTWYNVESGTNPRFLYQQNSLRDALVAATNLNIFNNHCRRVYMTNIAQTVNVLQAMLLTQEDQMVKTPTYYVYKMFAPHHEATLLPSHLKCEDYRFGENRIPSINASASVDKEGVISISLVNLDHKQSRSISCILNGAGAGRVTGQIITSDEIGAYNDFGKEEKINLQNFDHFKTEGEKIVAELPAKSVVMLRIFTD